MARSWASVVRGKEVVKKVVVAKAPEVKAPEKPKPKCVDCGADAMVCAHCRKAPVYLGDECVICLIMNTDSEGMCGGWMTAARMSNKVPYKCKACYTKKRWEWTDNTEIVSYTYKNGCHCHPISKDNVIRSPVYRRVGEKPTDPKQREEEAMAAFKVEMKFSNDTVEAMEIYASFFKGAKKPSLEEILAKAKA